MSTNKTQNHQLHAWEPEDDFLLSEFNANFAAIDGILAEMPESKKLRVAVGGYAGTGESVTQAVTLGFRPKVILISPKFGFSGQHMTICVDGVETLYPEIADNGFTVKNIFNVLPTVSYGSISGSSLNPYAYVAIGWAEGEE